MNEYIEQYQQKLQEHSIMIQKLIQKKVKERDHEQTIRCIFGLFS